MSVTPAVEAGLALKKENANNYCNKASALKTLIYIKGNSDYALYPNTVSIKIRQWRRNQGVRSSSSTTTQALKEGMSW